ncbi:MAG: FKBP-type peptidyl-prolyl cis-trans isomerase [Clostridiales bacterium]|nr:FKBP-type peptidyl-prolyl cis-trans isomerase [Clostridiales bacterium]
MKKKMTILALATCAALAASGCGSSAGEDEDTQTAQAAEAETEADAEATALTYDGVRSEDIEIDLSEQVTSLCDYTGIDLEITGDYEVSDEYMEQCVLQLISYYGDGTAEVTDRDVVEDGDYVLIDYTGYMDGEAFDGGAAEDVMMDVTNNLDVTNNASYIDGFCDDLVGSAVGDVIDTDVTFPEDYAATDFAGQPATFEITVKGIYRQITFDEVTDDIVSDAFGSSLGFETRDDLVANVAVILQSQAESQKAEDTLEAAQEYVRENSEVEIPQDYLQARKAEYEYYTAVDYCEDGQTLEEYFEELGTSVDEFWEQYESSLVDQIKTEFLFERIAELEGMEIDEDGFETYAEQLMSSISSGFDTEEELYEYYGAGDAAAGESAIRKLYLANEAMSYVTENANVIVAEEENA